MWACAPRARTAFQDVTAAAAKCESFTKAIVSELARYKTLPQAEAEESPFSWWRKRVSSFPILSYVAKMLLGVPGSTAALERAFSHAGQAVGPKRPRLDPRNACALIYLHENVIRKIF